MTEDQAPEPEQSMTEEELDQILTQILGAEANESGVWPDGKILINGESIGLTTTGKVVDKIIQKLTAEVQDHVDNHDSEGVTDEAIELVREHITHVLRNMPVEERDVIDIHYKTLSKSDAHNVLANELARAFGQGPASTSSDSDSDSEDGSFTPALKIVAELAGLYNQVFVPVDARGDFYIQTPAADAAVRKTRIENSEPDGAGYGYGPENREDDDINAMVVPLARAVRDHLDAAGVGISPASLVSLIIGVQLSDMCMNHPLADMVSDGNPEAFAMAALGKLCRDYITDGE